MTKIGRRRVCAIAIVLTLATCCFLPFRTRRRLRRARGVSRRPLSRSRPTLGQPPNYKLGLPALPAEAPLPKGTADDQAAQLAADVADGGAQSLPALLTALTASGIALQAANGSLLRPASSPGQGILIDQGTVEVLEMLAQNDILVPLTDFARAVGAALPALKLAPVAADISTACAPTLRPNNHRSASWPGS